MLEIWGCWWGFLTLFLPFYIEFEPPFQLLPSTTTSIFSTIFTTFLFWLLLGISGIALILDWIILVFLIATQSCKISAASDTCSCLCWISNNSPTTCSCHWFLIARNDCPSSHVCLVVLDYPCSSSLDNEILAISKIYWTTAKIFQCVCGIGFCSSILVGVELCRLGISRFTLV